MERVTLFLISLATLLLGITTCFVFPGESQSLYAILFLLISATAFCLSRDNLHGSLLIISLLPALIVFNYIKINLNMLEQLLQLPPLMLNLSAVLYLLLSLLSFGYIVMDWSEAARIPLFKWIVIVVIFFLASISWSAYPEISFPQIILQVTPLAIYLLLFKIIKAKRDYLLLLGALAVSALIPLGIGLIQFLTSDFYFTIDSSLPRIPGPFHHPNNFGIFLLIVISQLIIMLHSIQVGEKMQIYRKLLGGYLLALIAGLILTYSRTSWVALLIFMMLYFSHQLKKVFKTILIIAAISSVVLIFEIPRERVLDTFERTSYDSIEARETIFRIGIDKFKESPAVGYGVGMFEELVRSEKENYESSSFPHNDALLFLVEGGVIGLLIYICLSLAAFYYIIKAWLIAKQLRKTEIVLMNNKVLIDLSLYGRGVVTLFIIFMIVGLAEATYRQVIFQILLWSFLGGWLAFVRLLINQRDH